MYLVDGNNVMAQRVGWHRDKHAARRRLVAELAHLCEAERTRITVVFDGPPSHPDPPGCVEVLFARPGSDADTRILEVLAESADEPAVTVVTSDRALAVEVRERGFAVLRSGTFRRMLEIRSGNTRSDR